MKKAGTLKRVLVFFILKFFLENGFHLITHQEDCMIRAVFFDLDGTLLDSKKQIPESAKAAIRCCREMGIRMYFATARSPRLDQTLDWAEDEFALFDSSIYSNGACVNQGNKMAYCFIDPQAVRLCVEKAATFEGLHLSVHMPQEGYAFNFPVDESMHKSWGLANARICALDEYAVNHATKMLMFYDHLTDSQRVLPAEVVETIKSCCGSLAKVYMSDEGRTIQVSGREAGKLQAIEQVRMNEGLGVDEVAVFGDDVNDLEMIEFYPNSVAMGNAVQPVKDAAGFITKTNDEGGIAYALDKLMNQ